LISPSASTTIVGQIGTPASMLKPEDFFNSRQHWKDVDKETRGQGELWKVESAGTRDLTVAFHRQLRGAPETAKSGMKKAEALRQAAPRLMKNPATGHPFYRAGFVLAGDAR
jgi:CHAT domain